MVRYQETTTSDNPRRTFTLKMRQSDYDRLFYNAKRTGVSMSEYLVRGLQPPVEQLDPETIREILRELKHTNRQIVGEATNVNQIAHWANAHESFPAEAEELARQIRAQMKEINAVRRKLAKLL
ncbi:MobC family plasmid mobilization relaxosome protein [Trueperella pyogenes]|uniref:MobC family plasmid mobilization relaxosome protein n=1 Tax=Trueperella pyogenes TaxID=1661 RepID=UPI00345D2521